MATVGVQEGWPGRGIQTQATSTSSATEGRAIAVSVELQRDARNTCLGPEARGGVGLRQVGRGRAARDTSETTPRAPWARQRPSQGTSSQAEIERRARSGSERSTPESSFAGGPRTGELREGTASRCVLRRLGHTDWLRGDPGAVRGALRAREWTKQQPGNLALVLCSRVLPRKP
jgi:hypothetical protein